jgi:hypothetical protein
MKTRFDNKRMVKSDMEQLGETIGRSVGQAVFGLQHASRPTAFAPYFKETGISHTEVSIYGRNSIFDCCSPGDVFGLQVSTNGLMQWLGWRPNRFYRRRVDFIPWYGPEGTHDGAPETGATDPCADPHSWEYGVCGYDLCHKSWYSIASEGLDPHTIVQDRCETSPRFRLNGIQIMDDVEWQMNGIMNVIAQQVRRAQIHGSHDNANEMNGIESLIRAGYENDDGTTCPFIDSIMVDWAHDDLDGTGNGFGNFFDYLDEVVTDIEYRSQDLGGIAETDMILLTSRFMATCLLDAYACYTTCGVTDSNDVTDQALRAQQRAARMALNGGPLYDGSRAVGFLNLKSGRRVPIIVEDSLDITRPGSSYCTDIYLLTRQIGSQAVFYGEYLDLRTYETRVKKQMPTFGVRTDAAGRFAMKGKEDNFCLSLELGTSPEIYLSAPWAQARFSDVCCGRVRKPLSGDPFQPFYMPGYPLHKATSEPGCDECYEGEGAAHYAQR